MVARRPSASDPASSPTPGRLPRRLLLRAGADLRRRPWLLTLVLCLLSVGMGLTGSDTAAQEYRVWLFRHAGAVLWDDQWYGGHNLPGYSVLFPPLGALFGVAVIGTAACVASTMIVTRLLRGPRGNGHDLGLLWFAAATVVDLVVGRMPFALGLAFGALALLGVREARPWLTGVSALLCSLASPLAGMFLLLVGLALLPSLRRGRVLPLAGALGGIAVSSAFPETGTMPFPLGTLVAVLLVAGVGILLAPPNARILRRGLFLYACAAVVFFLVPTPVGGNMVRPASLLAGPAAAILLSRRRTALLLTAVPLLIWQLGPIQSAVAGYRDPSTQASYYTALVNYLDGGKGAGASGDAPAPAPLGRVEIPMTRAHWEARFVAPKLPLARGWERQLDTQYNAILYSPDLDADSYHSWLVKRGVRYVALPDTSLDPAAEREAALLKTGLSYLTPVWHDAHWKVWVVKDTTGLTKGPAKLVDLGVDSLTVDVTAPGVSTVLVHFTPYWRLEEGSACIFQAADGWTGILSQQPGRVKITADFSVSSLVTRPVGVDCSADPRGH